MNHRWRDLWFELVVQPLSSFPYVRLSIRPVWCPDWQNQLP